MLERFVLRSVDSARGSEVIDSDRSPGKRGAHVANGFCIALVIVDLLLVKDGTSSTEMRMSGPGSPAKSEWWRFSATEDAAVPSRGVSREVWLTLNLGDEKDEVVIVSGVLDD